MKFILKRKFNDKKYTIHVASADADKLIVDTAITISSNSFTVVVGEDVDLLVLLSALAPKSAPMYFLKPSIGKDSDVI